MIFQSYADDSGSKNDGRVMVVAALVGTAEVWARVSDEWDRELRAHIPLPIGYFKEDEARHLHGEFRHWRPEGRDQKVQRLAKIIDRPDLLVVWYGLDLDAHRSHAKFSGRPLKNARRHMANEPYLFLMEGVMMAVAVAVGGVAAAQRLEIFLDEHDLFKQDIKAGYGDLVLALPESARRLMPDQPWFRDDKEFLPIQAADLVAGFTRSRIDRDPEPLPIHFTKLRVSPSSQFIDGKRLLGFTQAHTKQKLTTVTAPRITKKKRRKR